MQNPNWEVVIQKSINALPLGPKISRPNSEYEVIWLPAFFLHAIYKFIVYIFIIPHTKMARAPTIIPTFLIAAGVAKIPIPI